MTRTVRVLLRGGMWPYLGVTLAFAVATVAGVWAFGYENLFGTYLSSNTLLCLMFYLMSGIMLGSIWLDICLSMGTTRRRFFLGLEATMLLGLAAYLAIMAGVGEGWRQLAAAGRVGDEMGFLLLRASDLAGWLQLGGMLAVFGQIGLLLGTLNSRIGRVWYTVALVLLILVCIAMYLIVGFSQTGMFTLPPLLRPMPLGCLCLALALAAGAGNWALIRRHSVR